MGRSDLLLEENCRKIGGKIQQKNTRRKGEEKKEIKISELDWSVRFKWLTIAMM